MITRAARLLTFFVAAAPMTASASDAPTRVKSWPKLDAFIRGEAVNVEPTMSPVGSVASRVARGAKVFSIYCVSCHGAAGKGDGPRGPLFEPPPRDFTAGKFKFRSTPMGTAPTGADLFRVVTGGLRGTGMPSFADLPEVDRWAVVAFVRSLAPNAHDVTDEVSVAMPGKPDAKRGKRAWLRLGCMSCHGKRGRGDGFAARRLGHALLLPDFAVQPFKRGSSNAEIYRSIATGLDGTPMPAYGGTASPEEIHDLVAFVRTLRDQPVDAAYRTAADSFIRTQYAQARHVSAGGCGSKAKKLKSEFEASRTALLHARRR